MSRAVITESDIPLAGDLKIEKGAIVTPSARDLARDRGVRLIEVAAGQLDAAPPHKTIAIGSDHGGFEMKEQLKPGIAGLGLAILDVGIHKPGSVDYPDIANAVTSAMAAGKATRGVLIDGAGIGSAMAANKAPGIRAALCYDRASANNSREHNDANVLTLGGRLMTPNQAEEILRVWLTTPFAGGRHQARIDKITAIEKANFK